MTFTTVSFSLYDYVGSSPPSFTDPTGLFRFTTEADCYSDYDACKAAAEAAYSQCRASGGSESRCDIITLSELWGCIAVATECLDAVEERIRRESLVRCSAVDTDTLVRVTCIIAGVVVVLIILWFTWPAISAWIAAQGGTVVTFGFFAA